MDRQSNLHGPRLDEAMKEETRSRRQGQTNPHGQEWQDPEPSGEDQPENTDWVAQGNRASAPIGMTNADVEGRNRLARFLPPSSFPGTRQQLLTAAQNIHAPNDVVQSLSTLPDGPVYENIGTIWTALGGGHEDSAHRS